MKYAIFLMVLTVTSANADNELTVDAVINHFDHQMSNQLERIHQNPLIKSKADLEHYSKSEYPEFPLNKLKGKNRKLFIESLTFNEKGLTGFNIQILQHLEKNQVYQILKLFGIGTFTDNVFGSDLSEKGYGGDDTGTVEGDFLKGYYCAFRASCSEHPQSACTKKC